MKLATYEAETIQIYFPSSLELQEELIKHGFDVPRTTPIPIIYINFKGWIGDKPPITTERLINPDRYGVDFSEKGWKKTSVDGKEAFHIPAEESYISFELIEKNKLKITLHPVKYHLERTSIRGINPEKWNNWAMAYISLEDAGDLSRKLADAGIRSSNSRRLKKEVQQGGKEVTFYLPVNVCDFRLCFGCFEDAMRYLKLEGLKQGIDVEELPLKLCLKKGEEGSFMKVGRSKMQGKHPQLMMKLASTGKRVIKGILKPIIEGKSRGILEYCDHLRKEQFFVVDAKEFLEAMLGAGISDPL